MGVEHCLSAMLAAGLYNELLALLKTAPNLFWHYRKYGVKAMAAMGMVDEALHYAESERGINDPPWEIAQTCEQVLLAAGRVDEAYQKYGKAANEKTTYLATFRALAKKYPHMSRTTILEDLIDDSPGDEGKWFATAKHEGLLDLALFLAENRSCEPRTLYRAVRDYSDSHPDFAVGVGIAALRQLALGAGYDISEMDVRVVYKHTIKAAENAGKLDDVMGSIRKLATGIQGGSNIVNQILGRELGSFRKRS